MYRLGRVNANTKGGIAVAVLLIFQAGRIDYGGGLGVCRAAPIAVRSKPL